MQQESLYTPGVCNINETEVAYRRKAGHVGVGMFAILLLLLVITKANPLWALALFIPAFLAAIGYLQAKHKFCISYAASGLHSVSNEHAETAKIVEAAQRKLDRNRARRMNLQATSIAFVATAAGYGLLLTIS